MGYSIGLFLDKAKAKESRVSVRMYSRGKGTKKKVNERIGNVPNLVVNTKHWQRGGGLTSRAPRPQQEHIKNLRDRIVQFQADLQLHPRAVTAAMVRRYLWPNISNKWTKLYDAAAAQGKSNTATRYRYSILSFERFCNGDQPNPDLFKLWALSLPKKYAPATVNSYVGAVRACFGAIDEQVQRKGLRVKEPKVKGGIALSAEELSAIYALPYAVGSSGGRHRDALICACITSLRSCDWHFFTTANIGKSVVNSKTGVATPIPMHPVLMEVIARNGGSIRTARNPNTPLRNIGKKASESCPSLLETVVYRKREVPRWYALVSHVARRTYVSHGFSHKVDPEELLRFTGHSSFKQLIHYNAGTMTVAERADMDTATATRVLPLDVFIKPLPIIERGGTQVEVLAPQVRCTHKAPKRKLAMAR